MEPLGNDTGPPAGSPINRPAKPLTKPLANPPGGPVRNPKESPSESPPVSAPRLLLFGAHPDDCEYHAGGLIARYRSAGGPVRMISVTDGGAGHHLRQPEELRQLRRLEFARSGRLVGAEAIVWDYPDGELQCTLALRQQIIAEIRRFQPDLVLTHRVNDYHPDHRAVGQAVQDASFMVTVPRIVPEVTALRVDPVVATMVDLFTVPAALRPDLVLDVTPELPTILAMLECHASQVFEWLPYNARVTPPVPDDESERRDWLRNWFLHCVAPRRDRFQGALRDRLGIERLDDVLCCEAYEISEYAAQPDPASLSRLFPSASCR